MTLQTHVAIWFLLSSLLLFVCLTSAPPLTTVHNINSRGGQREQTVKEGKNVGGRQKLLDEVRGREVDLVPLSRLSNLRWRDMARRDDIHSVKRGHSPPRPLLQQPTMPDRGEKVKIKERTDNRVIPALTNTAAADVKATNTATTAVTTTTPHPVIPTPPLSSSFSSCSTPACEYENQSSRLYIIFS